MANAVLLENPGNLDLRAAATVGVNVKENDDAFGRFGSGFCYSIATLLRHGIEVDLWIDRVNIPITVNETLIRGKPFSLVVINGVESGFTTDLGKDWELWMAYRELYSNARDEFGDHHLIKESEFTPKANTTQIVLRDLEMIKIFEEKSKYFISEETHGEPLWENSEMQIFRQLKNTVSSPFFYQGIRVSKSEYVSDFVYNLLKPSTDLTEDRTIDSGSFKNEIGVTLYKSCENQQFLEDFFMAEEGLVETECDVNWWMTPTDAFVAATEPMLALTNSQSLKSWLLNRKPLSEQFDLREADENEQLRIDKGLAFLEAANYKVTCQIMVTDSPTAGALAMALPDTDTIVLTPKLFDMGMQWVVRALIEEQMHLQHKVRDHSREMQNLLFTWLIQEYEKRTGQVL